MTTAVQQPIGSVGGNALKLQDMIATATDLGRQAGEGKDVQVKFLLKTIECAFQGAIDLTKNKHGQDKDDAALITEAYVKAQTGATVFDTKALNQRVAMNRTRTAIKLGGWTKGGPGQPMQNVDDLLTERQRLRKDPTNVGRLQDAANIILAYAREQVKRDHLITSAEFGKYIFKPGANVQTEEDYLAALRKTVEKHMTNNNGFLLDNATATAIKQACTKRLTAIAKAKAPTQAAA